MAISHIIMYPYTPFTSVPPSYDHTMPPPSTIPRKRKIAPRESASSPEASEESHEPDTEYDPPESTRKRPTKPGKPKASSREALRKANHSLIERRRREKINAALADLREMVPGLGDDAKGGEFKLEVLERTVAHMRELKDELALLKKRAGTAERADEDETESEAGLPPPLTVASRPAPSSGSSSSSRSDKGYAPSHPSLASLLSNVPAQLPTRPAPPPQASNPTLYLPYPTPSPTSPFLSYSSSTSNSTAQTEPSPFIAPIHGMPGMSLFGGALDGGMSPINALGREQKGQDEVADAAHVLVAFASPDVMRPTIMGMTPIRSEADFSLDGQTRAVHRDRQTGIRGKTARDILDM